MLIGIDPVLGPDCLALLRAMGHGDEVVLADANFPAAASGRRLVRLDGVDVARALDAVLSVLPVDDFEPDPLVGMRPVGEDAPMPPVIGDMQGVVDIQTGERRFYGNIIVRKGVIPPA